MPFEDTPMENVMIELAKKHIKYSEDYKEIIYLDSKRYPTFGWGHCFTSAAEFPTVRAYADYLFEQDFARAYADYVRLLTNHNLIHLSAPRRLVLLDMCYNMNYSKLSKFVNTIKAMQESRWDDAVAGLKNSKWYRDTGLRAKRLCKAFEENRFPLIPNKTASGVQI